MDGVISTASSNNALSSVNGINTVSACDRSVSNDTTSVINQLWKCQRDVCVTGEDCTAM